MVAHSSILAFWYTVLARVSWLIYRVPHELFHPKKIFFFCRSFCRAKLIVLPIADLVKNLARCNVLVPIELGSSPNRLYFPCRVHFISRVLDIVIVLFMWKKREFFSYVCLLRGLVFTQEIYRASQRSLVGEDSEYLYTATHFNMIVKDYSHELWNTPILTHTFWA